MATTPIKIGRLLMPVATVLICFSATILISNSLWLQERIYFLHKDAFAIGRSLDAVWLAQTVLPKLLFFSLIIFFILKRQLDSQKHGLWEKNYSLGTVLVTVCLLLRFWQCPLAQDDSYIDYRYVQHWLNGQFDYNPGQHVMGFTSHLHLAVLWAVCALAQTKDVDLASYYLNCGLDTVNTIFLYYLLSRLYGRTLPAFTAGLCFAVSTFNCSQVIAGKETPLVNLVILSCLWAFKTSRLAVMPWCAAALFLLRPEGILSALVIVITMIRAQGRKTLKYLLLPGTLTAVFYFCLLLYFGTVLPHGMIAKHKVLLPADFITTFFTYISACGAQLTNSSMGWLWPGAENCPFLTVTLLIFALAFLLLREPSMVLYSRMALAQILFILFIQSIIFSWYFCWFALLVPILVARLMDLATTRGRVSGDIGLIILRVALGLFLYAYLRTGFYFAPYAWMPYLERGTVYREAAIFLKDRTAGIDTVAASDVGIIGYYYPGPILDLMGLISDQCLKYYPIKNHNGGPFLIAPAAISALKPKYLVAPISHCQDALLQDADFQEHYTELKRWTNPAMKDKVVVIWMRKEGL